MTDIQDRKDLLNLLREFYSRAIKDPLIGEKFNDLEMDHHIDIIADFWDSVLFGTFKYHGDSFGKHIPMALKKEDFDRWIILFHKLLTRSL